MKKVFTFLKVLLTIIIGIILYGWSSLTYKKGSIIIDSNLSIEEIWETYEKYWLINEPKMTTPKTCKPNTKQDIHVLEESLGYKLPIDLKKSLQIVNHSSKKCDDDKYHSWFGSKTGIFFYSALELLANNNHDIDLQIADYSIYEKGIIPYKGKDIFLKEWLVIASNLNIYIFLDLRNNIGNQYGQVLAYLPTSEHNGIKYSDEIIQKLENYIPDPNNSYNNFIFIAQDYKTFLQLMLEEIKSNGEVKNRYFTNLFNLPIQYFW
jgi:hypothetical protein